MRETDAKKVELVDLSKTFITSTRGKVHAVQHVDLTMEPGEFVTLLGPSGCGKTTLLRMIAGFEMPTTGKILINGEDVISKTPDKRGLGMVFQNYALFPHLNVYNNIAYGLKNQKLPKEEIDMRVEDGLKLVQMDDFAERVPAQMSGGQQQRIALIRALVLHPGVLLFDEPLSNLDAKLRLRMRDEIRRLQQEIGITSVYVTHDQSEAMAMSDKIVVLKDGIVQQVGDPKTIYQHPRNEFVANFIGKANILEGTLEGKENGKSIVSIENHKYAIPGTTAWNVGDKLQVVVRPEACDTSYEDLSAKVIKTVYMGISQDYWVNFQGKELEFSDYNPSAKKFFPAGSTIMFGFKEQSLHIIEPEE